jgi:HAD superfamily hydrolase (TIGR01490 family)
MLAFFDMDRTLLRIDTAMSWMRFLRGRGELSRAGLARAAYWSSLYKLAVLDIESLAKRLALQLAGESAGVLGEKARTWYELFVAHQVAPAGRKALESHRQRGDLVVLLTAATQLAAEAVARGTGIEHVMCTRLEIVDGCFTGQLQTLCFGRHKVLLARQFAESRGLTLAQAAFYSDSFNDMPLLSQVGTAIAVNPDVRLRRHARRVGWCVERWDL